VHVVVQSCGGVDGGDVGGGGAVGGGGGGIAAWQMHERMWPSATMPAFGSEYSPWQPRRLVDVDGLNQMKNVPLLHEREQPAGSPAEGCVLPRYTLYWSNGREVLA
jgi:hypothetical protein